jgi:hypothetical protein
MAALRYPASRLFPVGGNMAILKVLVVQAILGTLNERRG